MIKMSFDEFDKIENKVETMPDILNLTQNFTQADMEQLFINFSRSTKTAPLAVHFLLYLQSKLSDDPQFQPTIQNANVVLKKYLELE